MRTGCVLVLAVLIQIVELFINSCFSIPDALLVCHSFIQTLTLIALLDFDMLLMHVLTAESFHILYWASTFTFPLIKLHFYFEVISLDISRSSSILFSSNMAYTIGHTKKGRNPIYISNLIFKTPNWGSEIASLSLHCNIGFTLFSTLNPFLKKSLMMSLVSTVNCKIADSGFNWY